MGPWADILRVCVCVFLNFCTQAYTVVINMPNDIYEGRYGKQFCIIIECKIALSVTIMEALAVIL